MWLTKMLGLDPASKARVMAGREGRRTLGQIDDSLTIERAVWVYEARAGHDCQAARECSDRIDALLDERLAVQGVRGVERRPVDGQGVRSQP